MLLGLVVALAGHVGPSAPAIPTETTRVRIQAAPSPFPHQSHEGLFTQCTICHRGAQTGEADAMFPPPAACQNCHDGIVQKRVRWDGPTPFISNLDYSHVRHQQSTDSAGETIACLGCHRTPGQTGTMAVSGPQPQYCIGCHAHSAPAHLDATARCATCHLPLATAPLPVSRIAALPKPSDHDSPDWVLKHAPASQAVAAGRCAICHARQSCERCHFNAATIPTIQALQPDARVAQLIRGRAPAYPKPTSHDTASWHWKHGTIAGGGMGVGRDVAAVASCSDCHVQASCRICHRQGSTPAIDALPAPGPDSVFGVRIRPQPVHAPGVLKNHPAQAAAGGACAACHARAFCVDCHQGQKAQYHAPNFVSQHGSHAYQNDTQCTACHSTEVFCRSCHLQTGRGARTRTNAPFHSSQPLWLLNHGQAARQGLDACAACHTQASCAQCHSATGGWGVNPHPSDFDARRAQRRNPQSCLLCHATLPNE
ncbi:MAG: cytochrome c3 family protein [Gemmatimonadaceae bacterium]